MKERPILFIAPMVRAILEGRKTQTRRVVKFKRNPVNGFTNIMPELSECPFGQVGDQLWVRETLWNDGDGDWDYAADAKFICLETGLENYPDREWVKRNSHRGSIPSIHMPRWASRIQLEITGIRVERLQDISQRDAIAEGVTPSTWDECNALGTTPVRLFSDLWSSINGRESWDENPWVWVVEFQRVKP